MTLRSGRTGEIRATRAAAPERHDRDELVSDQSSSFADLAALLSRAPAERIHDRRIAPWIPERWRRRAFLSQRVRRAMLRRGPSR